VSAARRSAGWTLRRAARLGASLTYRLLTLRERVLPTLFVLGPPRSGTSSLDHYLRQHPSYRPPLLKELGYAYTEPTRPHLDLLGWLFGGGLPRPVTWSMAWGLQRLFYVGGADGYRKLFPLARDMDAAEAATGRAVTADSTVLGLYARDTVDAFPYRAAPDAKFLTILREPADFLYSFYTKETSRPHYPVDRGVDFETFLRAPASLYTDARAVEAVSSRLEGWRPLFEERPHFDPDTFNFATAMVCYVVFLKQWASRVPEDRLLILSFTDLRDRTRETLDEVFRFLGMPPHPVKDVEARNVGAYEGRSLPPDAARLVESVCRPYNEELFAFLGRDLGW